MFYQNKILKKKIVIMILDKLKKHMNLINQINLNKIIMMK